MRRFFPLLILLLGAGAPEAARAKSPPKIVVITNVNIVDVATGTIQPRMAVVIQKGRITGIAKLAIIQESPLILVANGEGKYLIPGLWDMHIRLLGTDGGQVRTRVLLLLLANGVTAVRDVEGDPPALRGLRTEIEHGTLAGPRIVSAAPPGGPGADPAVVVRDREEARAAVESLKKQRPGAVLLAGTDSPPDEAPGVALHRALQLLVEAGLSPLEALRAATINPALFLGKEKEMAGVDKGKAADLVLLDANPLEDIGNLDKIAGVVVAGRYYSRRELDEMVAQAEAAAMDSK